MILIIALHHLLVIAYALYEARDDFRQISRHQAINHKGQWLVRAGIAFLLTAMAGHACLKYHGASPWICASLLLAFWPLFSLPFRVALNRMRKLDWRYMSPDVLYDFVFLWIVTHRLRTEDLKDLAAHHAHIYHSKDRYVRYVMGTHGRAVAAEVSAWRSFIHNSGLLATLTELTAFAIACWWMAQLM